MAMSYGSRTIGPTPGSGSAGGIAGQRRRWETADDYRNFFQRLCGARQGFAAGGIAAGFTGGVAGRGLWRRGEPVCDRRGPSGAARRRSGRGDRSRVWVLPAGGAGVGARPGEHDRGASAQRSRRALGARPGAAVRTCRGGDCVAAAARWPHVSAAAVGGRGQRRRGPVGATGGGAAGTFLVARETLGHVAADGQRRMAVRTAIAARTRGARVAGAAGGARADFRGRRSREWRVP